MVHRCLLIQASGHCHGLYMPLLSWGFEEILHSRSEQQRLSETPRVNHVAGHATTPALYPNSPVASLLHHHSARVPVLMALLGSQASWGSPGAVTAIAIPPALSPDSPSAATGNSALHPL